MFKVQTDSGEFGFTFTHFKDIDLKFDDKIIRDVTACRLVLPNTKEVYGVALCSTDDKFNKEVGRKLALQRALFTAGIERTIRREVWERYHGRCFTNAEYNGTSAPTPNQVPALTTA